MSTLKQVRCGKATPAAVLTRYIRLSTFIGMVITLVTSITVIDRQMDVLVAARDAICAGEKCSTRAFASCRAASKHPRSLYNSVTL